MHLTKVVLSCLLVAPAFAQEDLSELDQIDAETAPALKEPKVDMSKKSQNVDTSSSTCPAPECLCQCLKHKANASKVGLKPSFPGQLIGSACVCQCAATPKVSEIMKANPFMGAR